MVCEPYLKSEIFKEIANLEFFWKKMKKGGGIDSEWASVEDTSNVIFCRWKFRVFHGEACNRGLKIALIFDRHLKIVFDAHVSITDSEAYLYDRVVSARANEALELRRYKFDFANAVRQNCLKIRIKVC